MTSDSASFLNKHQLGILKQLAHHAKPIIHIGQKGLTAAVLTELDNALTYHELVKIKLDTGDRTVRESWITQIQSELTAALIQEVGHIAVMYRANLQKTAPLLSEAPAPALKRSASPPTSRSRQGRS